MEGCNTEILRPNQQALRTLTDRRYDLSGCTQTAHWSRLHRPRGWVKGYLEARWYESRQGLSLGFVVQGFSLEVKGWSFGGWAGLEPDSIRVSGLSLLGLS